MWVVVDEQDFGRCLYSGHFANSDRRPDKSCHLVSLRRQLKSCALKLIFQKCKCKFYNNYNDYNQTNNWLHRKTNNGYRKSPRTLWGTSLKLCKRATFCVLLAVEVHILEMNHSKLLLTNLCYVNIFLQKFGHGTQGLLVPFLQRLVTWQFCRFCKKILSNNLVLTPQHFVENTCYMCIGQD